MAILRGPLPTDSFTIISNAWLRDPRITWKCKGILAYIASHAAGHVLTMDQILAEGLDKIDAVRSALDEAEAAGYLRRHDVRNGKGHRIGTDFELLEPARESPPGKIQGGDDQGEQPVSAGQPQVGKSSVGKSDPKKTTSSKKTTEDQSAFAAEAADPTAQTIIAGFIDWLALPAQGEVKLTPSVIGRFAANIKRLLASGHSPDLIKHALATMTQAGKAGWPSLLDSFVVQVQNRPVSAPPAPRTFRQMDRDDRDRESLIVKAMDIVLEADPRLSAGQARAVVMDLIDTGKLDLKALSTSAPTGYSEVDMITVQAKEVTGS